MLPERRRDSPGVAIGTYLKISPGETSLRYIWTSPYAADIDGTSGAYLLTIQ